MIPNCQDLSYRVQFVMKTTQDKDMTDHIGVVYVENKKAIVTDKSGRIFDENQIG